MQEFSISVVRDPEFYQYSEPETRFYHWGDIDLGGFSICLRLKNEIIPQLEPYLMNAETLKKMESYAKAFGEGYRKKLAKALNDTRYEKFSDAIAYMLESGKRLEQEAFLI